MRLDIFGFILCVCFLRVFFIIYKEYCVIFFLMKILVFMIIYKIFIDKLFRFDKCYVIKRFGYFMGGD